MRLIGHADNEPRARTFSNYLYVQGIDNQIDFQEGAGWAIWVMDEDRLETAAKELAAFQRNPDDPKYQVEARKADQLRAKEEAAAAAFRKRMRTGPQIFQTLAAYGLAPLTLVLILICVGVFIVSRFATDLGAVSSLFISEELGVNRDFSAMLPEVRHGQVWRLVTPIFLHMGWLHIIFNMLWLRDLGSMIEVRQNPWYLAALVLVIGVCSNFGQYYMSGPIFGGMSGVVYGLLGYIWMRGKYDPSSGLFLHPSTVNMMLIWFVLCFTGIFGHVANTAHGVGLVVGVLWGYLSSLRAR